MDLPEFHRGRRLRRTAVLRDMVREVRLCADDLIMPYFVVDTPDRGFRKPIDSMPGQFQLSLDELEKQVRAAERAVEKVEVRLDELAQEMEKAASDYLKLQDLYAEREKLEDELAHLYIEWEKLAAELEEAKG